MKNIFCYEVTRHFLLLFLCLSVNSAWGKISHHGDGDVISMRSRGTTHFKLTMERQEGSTSSPHNIYYPFINACSPAGARAAADVQSFTRVVFPELNTPCSDGGALQGLLTIPVTSGANGYIYGAFETEASGRFKIISIQEASSGAGVGGESVTKGESKLLQIDVGAACNSHLCALPSNDISSISRQLLIFRSEDAVHNIGDTFNSDDPAFNEGSIYDIHLARKLPSLASATLHPSFQLYKGDTQVFVSYDMAELSIVSKEIHAVRVAKYSDPKATTSPYCDILGRSNCEPICGSDIACPIKEFSDIGDSEQSEVVLLDLENDQEVNLSLCVENKWGFCSHFPPTISVTPQEMEKFLQEQSCFFFSAGFAREHYVIERLKKFRDQVLIHYDWGKKVVNFYYSIAPAYAPYITQSPLLSAAIRSLGYLLAFVVQYYTILASLMALLLSATALAISFSSLVKSRKSGGRK